MDRQGDINLAKALQAEFGRAKPPRRRGRVQRRNDNIYQFQPLSEPRGHNERPVLEQHRARHQGRVRAHNVLRPSLSEWQGQLVTNNSPEADAFFHQHQRPLPSPAPQTVTENPTPSAPIIRQPVNEQLRPSNVLENSKFVDKSSSSASALPWHQSIDQSSTEAYLNAIPSISATPMHIDRPPFTEETEEQQDIEMESVDHSSTSASKSTTINTQKGLAVSMWNPANRDGRADSVSSNWSFETSSDTTKPTPIVTSGITKGPGLMASRWNQGF